MKLLVAWTWQENRPELADILILIRGPWVGSPSLNTCGKKVQEENAQRNVGLIRAIDKILHKLGAGNNARSEPAQVQSDC